VGVIPDFNHPVWWLAAVFVLFLFGLMVWFPVFYWWKDRARRRSVGGPK
jgi:hypothetical protein